MSVMLHDAPHGFREGGGKGVAILEDKLDQQLTGLAHEPLFQFLLNVWKAYDSMDWERCLRLLRGYRMGPNLAWLL